jgi:hypothetical protein
VTPGNYIKKTNTMKKEHYSRTGCNQYETNEEESTVMKQTGATTRFIEPPQKEDENSLECVSLFLGQPGIVAKSEYGSDPVVLMSSSTSVLKVGR